MGVSAVIGVSSAGCGTKRSGVSSSTPTICSISGTASSVVRCTIANRAAESTTIRRRCSAGSAGSS